LLQKLDRPGKALRPMMREFLSETTTDYFRDGLVAVTKGDFVTTR
jgi:hypothetical protein